MIGFVPVPQVFKGQNLENSLIYVQTIARFRRPVYLIVSILSSSTCSVHQTKVVFEIKVTHIVLPIIALDHYRT